MMSSRAAYVLSATLFVLILGLISTIVYLMAANCNTGWDLSRSDANTLDPRTVDVLKAVDFDVRVTVFDKPGKTRDRVRDLLDLFALETAGVRYELIHPDIRPGMARRFGIDRYGMTVISGRGRQVVVEALTEESFANALLKLKRERKKNIYVTCGHGEPGISRKDKKGLSLLAEALRQDGYGVTELLTISRDEVPGDADLIVVAGPRTHLVAQEVLAIREFLRKGGNVLVALEPMGDKGLGPLLDEMGIDIEDDLVVDPSYHMAGAEETVPVVSTYGRVGGVTGYSRATVFPTARPLVVQERPPAGVTVSWLARTSDQSWAERDRNSIAGDKGVSFDPADRKGPLDIALLARKQIDERKTAWALVFGDADILTNAYFNVAGNRDFVMNCINEVLDQGYLISLNGERHRNAPFVLTPGLRALMFWVPVAAVPSILLFFAALVAWKRRQA